MWFESFEEVEQSRLCFVLIRVTIRARFNLIGKLKMAEMTNDNTDSNQEMIGAGESVIGRRYMVVF